MNNNIIGTGNVEAWNAMRNLKESIRFAKERNNHYGFERQTKWYKEWLQEYTKAA